MGLNREQFLNIFGVDFEDAKKDENFIYKMFANFKLRKVDEERDFLGYSTIYYLYAQAKNNISSLFLQISDYDLEEYKSAEDIMSNLEIVSKSVMQDKITEIQNDTKMREDEDCPF